MNQFATTRDQNRSVFRLRPVAAGCAVFVSALAGSAFAQQADVTTGQTATDAPVQVVTVTGIRRGIEAAISVKRTSDSIVEAISAEDIGKLPDQSIAESIARLPGVTAQRTRGGASQVSIRGMSADFSTGLLNGREQVSTGDSRGIEFDQYPAELLAGVTIYKTPDGALVGQGLTGTIDMQTIRPLNFGKRQIAANFKREKNSIGQPSTGAGNRVSLSYIDQFADRKIGLAIGFARLDGTTGATTRFESWGSGEADYQGQKVKVPYNGFNAFTDVQEQARDGAAATLQFRPNKNFSSTLDVFYSKYDRQVNKYGFQAPLNDNWVSTSSVFDQPGQLIEAVIANGSATSGKFNNVRAVLRNDVEKTIDTTRSIGWETRLRINADWTALADVSYNTANRTGRSSEAYAGTARGKYDTIGFTAGSNVFSTTFPYDRNNVQLMDTQGWGGSDIQMGYTKVPNVEDKIKALRLSAKRDLPEGMFFKNIDFGVNFSDRSKSREYTEALLVLKGNGGPTASLAIPGTAMGSAADTSINVPVFDPVANIDLYDQKQKLHPDIFNKDWIVSEKVTTTFAKMNIDSSLAGFPLTGAVGLQIVKTDQESSAYSVNKDGALNNNMPRVTDGHSYTDVLPSANFILEVGDQQNVRLSVAKIMARSNMNDMRASAGFGVDSAKNIYSGSGGNPRLDPFRAKGVDLSYERYWGSKAYTSLAAFYKKLDTYVVQSTFAADFTPFLTPSVRPLPSNIGEFTAPVNGKGGNIKGVEASASVPFGMITKYLDGFGAVFNASVTSSDLDVPDTTEGGSGKMELPGLSKKVGSLTLYYEKAGFSARVASRYRSDFVGEVSNYTGDRQNTYIKAENLVDLQLGYEIQRGPLKNLSFNLSVNNLSDANFVRYRKTKDNVIEDAKYGKTVLFGINYKM